MYSQIPGYTVIEKIFESTRSAVLLARRSDELPVVLKLCNETWPPAEKIARLRGEFEMITSLEGVRGVIRAYDFLSKKYWGVALEDIGGQAINRLEISGQLTIRQFLELAIKLNEVLAGVHARGVMHRDINPSNWIYNPGSGEVRLIDFGIATTLASQKVGFAPPERIEGTLTYISPEQTGRMNRGVDYRSDLYSMGATLFETLTGKPPFLAGDPAAMVHAHIGKVPPDPAKIRYDCPPILSSILLKLLEKDAENRYQTAEGLIADLQNCLHQLECNRRITPFPLGEADLSERFQLPQKLYGREKEIDTLLDAFEQTGTGGSPLVLVAGMPGIGKTTLVQEVFKPLTRKQGYFAPGKFDQFQRNIPYLAWVATFQALIHQILTETEEELEEWKERFLSSLGANAGLVTDLVPDLELIIGRQPVPVELPAAQAPVRFRSTLNNFLGAFIRSGRPVVFFLDDLQWADAASVDLLFSAASLPEIRNLFIVAAYRENEVDESHPFHGMLQKLKQSGLDYRKISLRPIGREDITRLIEDALGSREEEAEKLATLVYARTEGNPFFVNEFLKSLYGSGLIRLSRGGAASGVDRPHRWEWDIHEIMAQPITDNVVELVAGNVQQLSQATQEALRLAACLGSQFDTRTLAGVAEKPVSELAEDLSSAISSGLIFPVGDSYRLVEVHLPEMVEILNAEYAFAHDRIRQAVYSLIPEADVPAIHWRIGSFLWKKLPSESSGNAVFELINHLNLGIAASGERTHTNIALLNLNTGRLASRSASFTSAVEYFLAGINVLPEDAWETEYDLALKLHNETIQAAASSGKIQLAEELIELTLSRACSTLDQLPASFSQVEVLTGMSQFRKALEVAMGTLESLGVPLPKNPTREDVLSSVEEVKQRMRGRSIAELENLAPMTDPVRLAAMQMLSGMSVASYNTAPTLYTLVSTTRVCLSIDYGNAPVSPASYAAYGLYLCNDAGEYEEGYEFGKLATRLLERKECKPYIARTLVTAHSYITHWKEHLSNTLAPLMHAYRMGLEVGDVAFLSGALVSLTHNTFYLYKIIPDLVEDLTDYNFKLGQLGHKRNQTIIQMYLQMVKNLLEPGGELFAFKGEDFDEDEVIPLQIQINDRFIVFHYNTLKLFVSCLMRNPTAGVLYAEQGRPYIAGLGGYVMAVFHFYEALARLEACPPIGDPGRQDVLGLVVLNLEKLSIWAQNAPENFLHKENLVRAELARLTGEDLQARELYDQAIDLARSQGYPAEEGLACELAAEFYLGREQDRLARFYIQEAHTAYRRWGCLVKLKDLETRYKKFFTRFDLQISITSSGDSTDQPASAGSLDLVSLIKASQAISREIRFDTLAARLMEIIIENAGASRGILLMQKEGHWAVQAEGSFGTNDYRSYAQAPIPLESERGGDLLPAAVAQYVLRTGQSLVLNDATLDSRFNSDPYVVVHQPRSVLCLPLLKQSGMVGLVYLENNLFVQAFTPGRIDILDLLSSQAAISLENALFYTELDHRVQERTRELEQEVARRKQAEERLQELATTDSLTGAYNRRRFMELLIEEHNRAVRYQKSFAVLIFDLDHFKKVNDCHGHQAGDLVLTRVVQIAQETVRKVDVVARYGGEEFIILLPEGDKQNGLQAAERLRKRIEQTRIQTGSGDISVTASFGVASFNSELDAKVDKIINRADQAMYEAKHYGRNRVVGG